MEAVVVGIAGVALLIVGGLFGLCLSPVLLNRREKREEIEGLPKRVSALEKRLPKVPFE